MCGISKPPCLAFDFKINTFRKCCKHLYFACLLSSSNSETGNNFLSLRGTGLFMAFVSSKRQFSITCFQLYFPAHKA